MEELVLIQMFMDIKQNTPNNKISLHADYVLLYITKPHIILPNILKLIEDFGSFSGYRINWNKSEIMSIKPKDSTHLLQFPFKIATGKI